MKSIRELVKALDEKARQLGYNPRSPNRPSNKGTLGPIDEATTKQLHQAAVKRVVG